MKLYLSQKQLKLPVRKKNFRRIFQSLTFYFSFYWTFISSFSPALRQKPFWSIPFSALPVSQVYASLDLKAFPFAWGRGGLVATLFKSFSNGWQYFRAALFWTLLFCFNFSLNISIFWVKSLTLNIVKTNALHFLTTNSGRQWASLTVIPHSTWEYCKFSQELLFDAVFAQNAWRFCTQDQKADTKSFEHAAFWESTAAYRTQFAVAVSRYENKKNQENSLGPG